jgi:hypothetical protein
MTMFRPEGLFPSQRRRRELHVGDELSEDEGDGEIVGALGPTPGSDELLGSEGDGGGLR